MHFGQAKRCSTTLVHPGEAQPEPAPTAPFPGDVAAAAVVVDMMLKIVAALVFPYSITFPLVVYRF
jgi:hypothetical protein